MQTNNDLKFDQSTHYEFGKNWNDFSQKITPIQIESAYNCLKRLLSEQEVKGKTFLDIGCGSGLHSLAALKLGVSDLQAIDFDPDSIETTKQVLSKFWKSNNYAVNQGNVFTYSEENKKKYDIVYSWGVLHHTGDMWGAIESASKNVKEGGFFVISIYKKTKLCPMWKKLKKFYNNAPLFIRKIFKKLYSFLFLSRLITLGRSPVKFIKDYSKDRGMNWFNDVEDWLGGYPYESASCQEVISFMKELNFSNINYTNLPESSGFFGSGCEEYIFYKNN